MQLKALLIAFTSVQVATAWRVHFYNHARPCDTSDCGGHSTKAGSGNPGSSCHNLWQDHDGPNLNNAVSQITYYPKNPANGSVCCIQFFNSADCAGHQVLANCDGLSGYNLPSSQSNIISSYRTNCS